MTNDKIVIGNGLTGESIERFMTDVEQAEHNAFIARVTAQEEALAKEQKLIEAKKNAAQAKLEALGLTADDLKALGL